ncbi:MAG: XrtA/PEP-CTERM system histidine kinase PrsK [Steroidobacteraceae bacterium]
MLGYSISAAVYALLLIGCLTVWRRRLAGSALASAFSAQFGWSGVLAAQAAGAHAPFALLVALEYLRGLAWATVLVRCLGASADRASARRVLRALSILITLVLAGALASLASDQGALITRILEAYWLWGGLTLSIAGLVLVEQVARNTRSGHEWRLKHVWLAIGGLFTWDLCVYSIAMLRGSAAPAFWVARGFVDAVLGGVLAVGLGRVGAWQAAVFLSPRLVFFNAALLGAAVYVLAMSAASYFVRDLGGSWGTAGQLVFLAVGALVLAVAVLSGQFRAWARVTLAKHVFPYRYDYRQEWRSLTRALSQSGETPIHERIPKVIAGSVNCASGGLWLRDADAAYAPCGGELAPPDAPREAGCHGFFEYLRQNEWICDLEDARSGGSRDGAPPPPPDWMLTDARIWLIVPLICEESLVGFVAIGEPLADMRLTWEEIDLLRAAGRQVASFLAFEQTARRLAEAHQFEALNRVSAALMHDLRHLIAQQALVVENAARHRGNPQFFDDAILTIDNSVKRMKRLMDELRSGVLTEQAHQVEVAELGAEVVRRCADRKPAPQLSTLERGIEVVLNRDRMLQVLEHVVRNAQDATASGGSVTVSVRRAVQRAVIEVADTGVGMDAEFIRSRLFRPFDTTKGERGMGIGAYAAREFVRTCGGSVEVASSPGQGTRFTIKLPLAPGAEGPDVSVAHELRAH